MLSLYDQTGLDPRDAIHVASMKKLGVSTLISEDSDFDKIDELERVTADEMIHRQL